MHAGSQGAGWDGSRTASSLILVGGGGDLSMRMLLPSLYLLEADGLLPDALPILAIGRDPDAEGSFRQRVQAGVERALGGKPDEEIWRRFLARLSYIATDATSGEALARLRPAAGERPVVYLAVSPDLYGSICMALEAAGLAGRDSRLALEKPLGRDLASCEAINEAVGAVYAERQVFRVDHYLGKDTVQNLLALRFGNALFEPLWNRLSIDHVQITVAETEGVGERWPYYDRYGALRDMVQNHILQLLCLIAMEPPAEFTPEAVRDQKVKVLRSLRPLEPQEAARGQYVSGALDGANAPAYADERGSPSGTETYVALTARIDNWRWSGVPFYLRTGKRLPERRTEIVVQFRPVPHALFSGELEPNQLVISLQPSEEISLRLMHKAPGLARDGMQVHGLPLRLASASGGRRRIAYERLLLDLIKGDPTLFVRRDEIQAAWRWVDGITQGWEPGSAPDSYAAGTWGPQNASEMIDRDGRRWRD
ncbi:glucose-6-phosphate dehydrogenase [Phenylobacterium deserti]|uniref:Glucose-6-phosphate 1-dehydrogenase n=1 Tax=Phenylobacterium deserti TaxID=1914756 RepID=A0A328ATA9_9CAUL|nr:glucose-6-phosphate dehydrogenase [Phenylobacterium deserti]RAK58190.1 glucose-6-phosphate dehydrogenase [Phenylobacterium deserti]